HLVSATVSALLAFASLKMVAADTSRHDTLAGGIPEWWFEVIMPVGFAVMAGRFAWKTPGGLKARLACFAPVALVAVLALLDLTHKIGPEAGSVFVGAHTKLFTIPGSLLLGAAFLLGTPV